MHANPEKLTPFEIAFREDRFGDCIRPTPIVRGIAKAESRPFGLNRWVFRVPLALAVVLALKDLIGGVL